MVFVAKINISFDVVLLQVCCIRTLGLDSAERSVTGVFDLHISSITSGNIALSAHIVIFDLTTSQEILQEINSILEKKFGIIIPQFKSKKIIQLTIGIIKCFLLSYHEHDCDAIIII